MIGHDHLPIWVTALCMRELGLRNEPKVKMIPYQNGDGARCAPRAGGVVLKCTWAGGEH